MRWEEVGGQTCSIARACSVLGDRWTLLLLREAFLRTRRFDDFQRNLGAARNIVADRLARLVEQGILERRSYQEKPLRYEYRLTAKGRDLYPVLMTLVRWGDRWMDEGRGAPVEHIHESCGHAMYGLVVCSHCGEPLDPKRVEPRAGPALRKLAEKRGGSAVHPRLREAADSH